METRIVINEIDTATQVSLSSFDIGDQINIVQYTDGNVTSPVISVNGKIGVVVLNKNDIGLGNVDNTSDLNKPISLATLSALNFLQSEINDLGINNILIVQATSANWNTAYNVATIVQSTSSSWEESADFDLYKGSVASLSGNWNSVYSTVSSISGNLVTIPSVTNYLSTNNVLISSIDVSDRTILENQLYHVADEDGQWIGNVRLKENNTRLLNIGLKWNNITPGTIAGRGVVVSSEGRIQIILRNSATTPILSNNYGKEWTSAGLPAANWTDISMSSDGKHRTAVGENRFIYVSNDYGITWNERGVGLSWTGVSVSADGKYQTAVAGNNRIWISNDFGNTWVDKETNRNWISIALNASGKIQTALVNGGRIYTSNDYGNNWIPKDNTNRSWRDVVMSSDGRYQIAVNEFAPNPGVYISNDYGNNWSLKLSLTDQPQAVACSSDGKHITVITASGKYYTSASHGNGTWKQSSDFALGLGGSFPKVDMSSDGKYQLAVGYSDYLSVADEEIDGELNVTRSVNYAQPYARFGIFSITGDDLPNLSNSTEHIIPWNTEEEPFSDIIETQLTNDNVVIKRNGTYHVKVRFSCFDMNDASDYLRIRLRQSTSPITNAAAGDFVTTLAWRFAGGTLAFAGEMYVEGETILRLTPETTGTVYLAATVLGSGGSGSGGTTFKPFINNSQGTQPFMEVRKVA